MIIYIIYLLCLTLLTSCLITLIFNIYVLFKSNVKHLYKNHYRAKLCNQNKSLFLFLQWKLQMLFTIIEIYNPIIYIMERCWLSIQSEADGLLRNNITEKRWIVIQPQVGCILLNLFLNLTWNKNRPKARCILLQLFLILSHRR